MTSKPKHFSTKKTVCCCCVGFCLLVEMKNSSISQVDCAKGRGNSMKKTVMFIRRLVCHPEELTERRKKNR